MNHIDGQTTFQQSNSNDPSLPPTRDEGFGAKNVRFDLSSLYSGINDPLIEKDLATVEKMYAAFNQKYQNNLSHALADALQDLEEVTRLQWKLEAYIFLTKSCDITNQDVSSVQSRITERLQNTLANHYTFFDHEILRLDEEALSRQVAASPYLLSRKPFIDDIRSAKEYYLDQEVERILQRRAPVSSSVAVRLYEKILGATTFTIPSPWPSTVEAFRDGLNLEEILEILTSDPVREVRRAALTGLNTGLQGHFGIVATEALNAVIGEHLLDCDDRGYTHPMAPRNLENGISDEVVEALHRAVKKLGPKYIADYYSLLARALDLPTPLAWSDRNASLDQVKTIIPWDEAVHIVKEAYRSFSPMLASLIDEVITGGDIDAAVSSKKEFGAYCWSTVLPAPVGVKSYVFLNYTGTPDAVETLAHEMGHAVHGLLSGRAQGPLLLEAPMAFAETASTFGEYVAFEYLLGNLSSTEDRFRMIMGKVVHALNTVVRQIGFSCFEQEVHARRAHSELTSEQFSEIWLRVCKEFYGEEGDVFSYKDVEHLWSYVSHFHSPFYVYSYAFGDLLTAALHRRKSELGDEFEKLFIDLLSAGNSKDIVELLKPFGIDPREPVFWEQAMEEGMGKMLQECERLFSLMKETPA
jgi:oligoendopeptidase F